MRINPNKAGLFEGSFFWNFSQIDPLLSHLQLLKNIFRVCWKWKNTDIICYKLTSLVSLSQGNVKKSKKLIKIDENSLYCQRKSPYLLKDLWNFNEIFRNDVAYDNIKNHKNPGIHYLFSRCFFKKTTAGVKLSPQPF